MCGIAALYKFRKNQIHESHDFNNELDVMLDSFAHRGPDGKGLFIDENGVGLGICRLAIVDAETGDQPIWNENHSVVVVCNGEIYNYHALREKLESDGHVFSSRSDVEVIVHLYESFGENCLEHLEGIFAFALWDTSRKKLFVARDRLGVKPLYYTIANSHIQFASEMRALLIQNHVNRKISPEAFYAYNIFRYVTAPHTMVAGVHKVEPGQCLVVQDGQPIVKRVYWQLPARDSLPKSPHRQNVPLLKEHIYRAVKSQIAPVVKSGILLSGGLDSTILLSTFTHLTGDAPDTYTVSFQKPQGKAGPTEYSEIIHASRVAKYFGSNHVYESYTANQVLHYLPSIVASVDEPIADPTAIPLWFATKLAHQSGVKVLYSGEGLDEIFNGYSVYNQFHWIRTLQRLPRFLRKLASLALAKMNLPGTGILNRSLDPIWHWYHGVGGVFTVNELEHMLNPEWFSSKYSQYVRSQVKHYTDTVQNQSILHQMTHFDVRSWLPENTLVKSDKVSMSHSIELRVPYLDHKLVDFALLCSDREKLRGTVGKRLVRDVACELVPPSVLHRTKAGFPVPITAWIFGEWNEYVRETLLNPGSAIREMYKPAKVQGLFKSQDRYRAGRMLWTLLTFELWIQNVFRKENSQRIPDEEASHQLVMQ